MRSYLRENFSVAPAMIASQAFLPASSAIAASRSQSSVQVRILRAVVGRAVAITSAADFKYAFCSDAVFSRHS